jgi:hypothetical protein
MYNLVDLLAFGFPLAAAINQLLILREINSSNNVTTQLNAGLFGFSVPLLSLHFVSHMGERLIAFRQMLLGLAFQISN